ncbi:conserved transmembrane protein [Babesia ovata]|uniref:Conserved transmembrane protein n=1 Tax=Babesia ovata TaxID=189622 RepID=A0A2H6KEH3_9APIC|nr:conserved transmembrane protein [Babesia ovata]GBE61393.1 conserved transmembrane protein [Babesia ovata]
MAANVDSRVDAANYYDPEKNSDGDDYCFSETTPTYVRHEFVKKVFGIVTLQLAATFGFLFTTLYVEPMKEFFEERPYIGIVAIVIFIVLSVLISCKRTLAHRKAVGAGLLVVLTSCMMLSLTCMAVKYGIFEVTVAAGITAALTLGIAIFAMQTKYDFTGWLTYLFCISLALIVGGIIMALFPNRIMRIVYSSIGALLMCIYLVVDIQMAVGGKKYEWTIDDYVIAALCIYVDIVSLFMHLLSLVGSASS